VSQNIVPVKITNLSSLFGSLGTGLTTICIIGYFALVAPATEAGDRERAAHAAVRELKVSLHAQLTGDRDPYNQADDIYDEPTGPTRDDIARMIAVPTGEVVEWALGPKPPWWEIGSMGDWGEVSPEELDTRIREAMKVLSVGQAPQGNLDDDSGA